MTPEGLRNYALALSFVAGPVARESREALLWAADEIERLRAELRGCLDKRLDTTRENAEIERLRDEWPASIVKGIVDDLADRRELKQAWYGIDPDDRSFIEVRGMEIVQETLGEVSDDA